MKEEINKSIELNIMGMKFPISTDKDSAYISKIEQFVNNRISEIGENSVSSLEISIKTCINIAESYFNLLEANKNTYEQLSNRFSNIVDFIDERTL